MKPYYQDDYATIYQGDGLGIVSELGQEIVSSIITDPPFSSGARTDAGRSVRGAMLRGAKWSSDWFSHDNMATNGFLYLMRLLCVELFRVCETGAAAHFFIDWRMYPNLYGAVESSGWVVKNTVVWDKGHFGMGSTYRNQHEFIIYAEKGKVEFLDHGIGNVLKVKRPRTEFHPSEKPLELLSIFIKATTRNDAVVLDPFMGSGTTLRAAKDLGRKSIGIEIEEKYCEIAANRLRQEVLEL